MQKHFRNIGFILLFLFLTGQSCEYILSTTYGEASQDCNDLTINTISHDAAGNVTLSWTTIGSRARVRMNYDGRYFFDTVYRSPANSTTFQIDWDSLDGISDEVILEFTVDEEDYRSPCMIVQRLQRPAPANSQVPTTAMTCANLALTSPLGGMANGMQTFYWDALEGAVDYRLNIYDDANSAILVSVDAGNALNTSLDVSQAVIGGETPLLVELVAFDAAGNACSQRYDIGREAVPPQSVPATATPTCEEAPKADYC